MSLMLVALAVVLPIAQGPPTVQSAAMKADIHRLVRAAEQLSEVWPSQPPPAISEVALVLEQEDPSMRVLAILALEKSNAREALPKLRALLQDDRKSKIGDVKSVADAARHAIATISQTK